MVSGKFGWYCPNRTDDPAMANDNGFCKYQVKANPQQAARTHQLAPGGILPTHVASDSGSGLGVRQAALQAAVEYNRAFTEGPGTVEYVLEVAKSFESYLRGQ
jgi:hypothetical protein